jgi:hypothetical protein
MNYKVGDRIRYVQPHPEARKGDRPVPMGIEGTVMQVTNVQDLRGKPCIAVALDNYPSSGYRGWYGVQSWMVEPLNPPKSQQVVSWESMPCNRDGSYRGVTA